MSDEDQEHFVTALLEAPVEWVEVNARERALLAYADKLTREPAAMGPRDILDLRAAGFNDRAIHDACAIIGYYAFVNRIADGLGVDLELERDAPAS